MRVLADGKTKLTMLTTEPADPENPTVTELAAGIDLSCKVVASDFTFGPTDSETVSEPALCDEGNAESLGRSNYEAALSIWREYLEAGGADPAADAAFQAVKEKGATLWLYSRLTDKKATDPWAAGDEIYFGAEVTNDTPQVGREGWIKARVPMKVQQGWPFIQVAAGA